MLFRKIFVMIMSLMVFSCSSVAMLKTEDNAGLTVNKTNVSDVKVYSTSDIGKEYKVLGEVVASADAGTNSEKAVSLLKKQASSLGADAIINLRLEIDAGYWQNAIKATGTAVKYN
jgi:uncharacterized protein YbjQ (UPF0145 family)